MTHEATDEADQRQSRALLGVRQERARQEAARSAMSTEAGKPPAGPTSASSPAAAPSANPPREAPQSFQTPADEWQTKYSDLESRYQKYAALGDDPDKLAARLSGFNKFGVEPEQLEQALAWARDVAAQVQAGKLVYADAAKSTPAAAPNPAADPFAEWDELDERTRAQKLTQLVSEQVAKQFKPEIDKYGNAISDWQKQSQAQMQLYITAAQLAAKNPDIPFEEILTEAVSGATMSPADYLKAAVERKRSPKLREQEIEQKVQARLAEIAAEREKKEIEALTAPLRPSPRLRLLQPGQDRAERKRQAFADFMRLMRGGKKAAGE